MSDGDIDTDWFRKRLLELREELMAESGNTDANTVELDQQRQGRLSRMDALGAQQMSLAAKRRRQETLRRTEAALRRIEEGDYGLCQSCDEPINPKRLEFDPTVLYCIHCASKAEQA
ncbi:MAG: TraR/DksA family transcriptional regulator [Halofilum sp. (in: g-proteobacteria)]|nr:TraR/DksA family transcriptional regulator [Halofilum sp. (in: g-proteobacteria)]